MNSNYKLVVVGDGAVGKTSLLFSYARGRFLTDHIPTVFDTYSVTVSVKNQHQPVQLTIFDTAGQEDYDRLRPLAYPTTDIFLVCFAVDSPESLENVSDTWVPEIRHYCGRHIPFVLVGLKTDLRTNDPGETRKSWRKKGRRVSGDQVTREMGEAAARRLGAVAYKECSALTQDGIKAVFDEALIEVALRRPARRRRCRTRGRSCGIRHSIRKMIYSLA
ncbi:cdc42 homolog [Patiria miniata]|uniref:Uncharacterized protein n=1 Tax=Patiria miniata TaxID=46514 RepID=A0A914BDJ4_PATMI|nr:cdc42 homolog [Patiria miniata]